LVLFVRIGTFQRVMGKKNKKIDSRLRLCANCLTRASIRHSLSAASRRGGLDPVSRKVVAEISAYRKRMSTLAPAPVRPMPSWPSPNLIRGLSRPAPS
jgi:hypothetical protein